MAKLPRLSRHETIKTLSKLGFIQKRQKDSHVILIKETKKGKIGCVVPLHKELETGTLTGILRQAKVSKEEFLNTLKKY